MAELLLGLKPRQVKTFPLRRTSSESTPSSAAASAAVSVRRTYQTSASSWLSATTDFSTESSTTRNTSCTAFCRRLQPPPRTTTCDLASMIDSYLLMLVISWTVTLSRGSCTKTPMLIRHYKWAMLCFSLFLSILLLILVKYFMWHVRFVICFNKYMIGRLRKSVHGRRKKVL